MEANEAPKKIILSIDPDTGIIHDEWVIKDFTDNIKIEYTRTDAFIEKACEFLSKESNIPLWSDNGGDYGCDTPKLVENFIKYMKEELYDTRK